MSAKLVKVLSTVTDPGHDSPDISGGHNDPVGAVHYRGQLLTAEKNWFDGMHRAISPKQTLENLQPMLREAGITRIADITGLDRVGLPVALAIRPNAWSLSVSSGKGLNWLAAAASAAMEAFELYHAETPELPVVNGSYKNLSDNHNLVSIKRLPFRKQSLFHTDLPLDWTFGWDLVRQEEVMLPLQMARLKADNHSRVFNRAAAFPRDTNGLASGNHFLEALCSGLYEVIERDAWACHLNASRSGGRLVPKIDLSAISHTQVRQVLDRLYDAGLHTHLYDCSVDTDVPVYRAVLCDPVDFCIPLADGYGAHLDPAIAMLRALTEAAQSRTVAISGSRDDMFDIHHDNIGLTAIQSQVDQLNSQPATLDPGNMINRAGRTFHEDVHILVSRLKAAGMDQLLVVELINCTNGMSVLKVIVPGLEPCLSHGNAVGSRARTFAKRRT